MRQVHGWFGALVKPTGVYLTSADFRDRQLASEAARKDLVVLADTLLILLRRLDPAALSPMPLAAKFTWENRRPSHHWGTKPARQSHLFCATLAKEFLRRVHATSAGLE